MDTELKDIKEQTENYANRIWAVADLLRGSFNDDQYGEIILPFALLRRFEYVLEPTREKVRALAKQLTDLNFHGDAQISPLCNTAGYPFYNTSEYTLATLGTDDNLKLNLLDYVEGFSQNVREILSNFDFEGVCDKLEKNGKLGGVVDHFKNLKIDATPRVMSNIYEELIWRFASAKHKASKEYLTPRDVVHLATTLVLDSDDSVLVSKNGLMRTIYDPTCGTCGFITDAMELIRESTSDDINRTTLVPYGQEINQTAWAMGKSMMLLAGNDEKKNPKDNSKNIHLGDTLKNDLTQGQKFDYVFSNPPFGLDWSDSSDAISKDPRFSIGLPATGDSSMLFLTHVAQKLNSPSTDHEGNLKSGLGAIVLSGSALFTGNPGTGPSDIRRWLFENDLVEAIIQLPGGLFYNTDITSYLWLLNTGKVKERRGKVLLIDATNFKTPIKNIGKKRYVVSPTQIRQIAEIFMNYKDGEHSRVFDHKEFGVRMFSIKRPLRAKISLTDKEIASLLNLKELQKKLKDDEKAQLLTFLETNKGEKPASWLSKLWEQLANLKVKVTKSLLNKIFQILLVPTPEGDIVKDDQDNTIYTTKIKKEEKTHKMPLLANLDEFFEQEVKAFDPDAEIDTSIVDDKDGTVGIIGYEVYFSRYFYQPAPLRELSVLAGEFNALEEEEMRLKKELFE